MKTVRIVCVVLLIVSCKIDRHDSETVSRDRERARFDYHLELKGKGALGFFGKGHPMLGQLGCLTMTVDHRGAGYQITGTATRKAKKIMPDNSEIYVVQVNDTLTIDVDKNYRPTGNHNQFSLLRYFVHLAKTGNGNKGLTFGYDMDFGGKITAVDGRLSKVKRENNFLRYEMKGEFIKGQRRQFNLGHTLHRAAGELVKAEIVIPKDITGEKTDVGVLLTPVSHCQVAGGHGQRWNFDNPIIVGRGA